MDDYNKEKSIIANRIKELIAEHETNASQLSKGTKIAKSSLSDYLNEKNMPKDDKIRLIAKYFGASPSWIRGIDGAEKYPKAKTEHPIYKGVSRDELDEIDEDEVFEKVPLLGEVAAGVPIYMDDYTNDTINVDKRYIQYGYDYICLTIRGDSMYPILMDKDIVLIKCQPTANSNDIAIVSVDNETATAKYVYKHEDKLELRPANLNYMPLFFSKDEVNTRIRIIGVVTNLLDRKL